jgi:hypothetical protein
MSTGNETDERDPYAPPPEGAPDRPPAAPWNAPQSGGGGQQQGPERPQQERSPWGQPRRPRDEGEGERTPGTPKTPAEKRKRLARIALWAGAWALFLALFLPSEMSYVFAFVLGVAAVAMSVKVLRKQPHPATPGPRVEAGPGSTVHTPGHARAGEQHAGTVVSGSTRPSAALVGLVTGALSLVWVLGIWSFQWANQDYYDCRDQALTKTAQERCLSELPKQFHDLVDNGVL